jgi:hypothetical protein
MATFGFSANDAKRIGAAVRIVEGDRTGRRAGSGYAPGANAGVRLLLAKHESTAGWEKESTAVVTIYNGDPIASAATVIASNQFLTFSTAAECTQRWVALGHNGWGWYAVAQEPACTSTCTVEYGGVDFAAVPGYDSSKIQILGHSAGGTATDSTLCVSIQWFDITTCATAAE